MADERNDLPPVSSANFLEKVREALSTYLGNRGSRLDRGLTVRDLSDAGLIDITPGYLSNKGRIPPVSGVGSSVESAYEVDLTPPPMPTGFTAAAAISNLLVECDAQTYTQGHSHARSILYGASWISGPLPVFADAVILTEFIGTVASHATNPATTWHLWLKWKTVDGVLSTVPAGGTNGVVTRTGEDVSLLLVALSGEITDSQLHTDLGTRIDLIDGGVTQAALPYPLAKLAALQDSLNQQVRLDLDAASSSLLESVTTISQTLQTVHDAGVYVEPGTGTVKIFGVEAANDHLTTVDVRLDAAEGNISLKASTTYVDGAIAAAVLGTADLALFSGVDLRLTTAEADISSLEGAVLLKATDTDLSATNVRMTTAEADINALEGQIVLKVNSADYATVTDGLDARLGSAEVALSSIGDVSAITSMVQQGNTRYRDDAADAETLLRSILNNEATADVAEQTLALAREDLTAYTDAGVAAEAAQRLLLAAVVGTNAASLEDEKIVRASQTSALSSASTTLAARLDSGDFAAVKVQGTASADSVTGLLAQYTVKLDVGGKVSGYGLASSSTSSLFEVRADKIAFASPYGTSATSIVPFVIDTVANKVVMDAAHIKDATITNAKIGDAQIDNAKISSLSAAKLTAGSIGVGDYIQSTGYVAGSAGWRINGDGTAELANAVVRGSVYANAGYIGGISIASNSVYAGTMTAFNSGSGFNLGSDGRLSLGNSAGNKLTWDNSTLAITGDLTATTIATASGKFTVNSAGVMSATDGNFSGTITGSTINSTSQLNGVTGTFSGTLTANAINAVNTINIAGEAVTVPRFAGSLSFVAVDSTHINLLTLPAMVVSNGSVILNMSVSSRSAYNFDNFFPVQLYITRNGITIFGPVSSEFPTSYWTTVSASVSDTPTGSAVYKLWAYQSDPSAIGGAVRSLSLSAIGCKK